jgi:pimeloyl-ACP methyl ester carboxylesterase
LAINPKTAVYFVPGLAAGKEIFEYISLPNHLYDIHILEWITPHTNESIKHYAKRMTDLIVEPNVILIGVSFGGVVAQEMSCFLKLKKLIIISSVKSANEIPFKLKILKRIPVYRLIPRRFLESTKTIVRYGLGVKSTNKLNLYQKYLSINDTQYLKWAIKQMVGWERENEIDNVIHIHGDKDPIFPIRRIKNCIVVPGGTHIMLITKFKWLNTNLPIIFDGNFK